MVTPVSVSGEDVSSWPCVQWTTLSGYQHGLCMCESPQQAHVDSHCMCHLAHFLETLAATALKVVHLLELGLPLLLGIK